MISPLKDSIGQSLALGDWVAYATATFSELRVGKIVRMDWVPKMDGGYWEWRVKALCNTRLSIPSLERTVRIENQDGRLGDRL